MRKIALLLVIIMIIPLFLTGCFDAKEVGEFAYVTVMGVEQGVSDKLRLTFQIPSTSQSGSSQGGGGGGGKEENKEKESITVEAPSFYSAVAIVNTSISKYLNFMHLEAMVVSEEMAKSGKMGELVATYARYRQIRRTTKLIICKGKAEEFVKALKPYQGGLITATLEELWRRSETTGFFPRPNLNDAYDGTKSYYHSFLGIYAAINKGDNLPKDESVYKGEFKIPGDYYAGDIPRAQGQDTEFLGSVLFDGDTMTGKLTGFETQMLLLMRNELKRLPLTIPDPEIPEVVIPIEIKEFEKPKTKIDISGDKPKIDARISLEGDIETIQSRINYENPEMKKKVENAVEKYLEDGIKRAFKKCKSAKSDVFGFGIKVATNFDTIPEWENYNWLSKFPSSELKVKVKFTVRRTGKMLKSMPVISSEGEG